MGTPAASDLTLAPGAGHGDKGDALSQGSAQERLDERHPGQPKPTQTETAISDEAQSQVINLARVVKAETAETVTREANSLVMTRPKPEKRKNAKERAKAKFAKDETANDKTAKDGTTPMTATAKSGAEAKAKAKAASKAASKAAVKAAKAERKARRTAARAA